MPPSRDLEAVLNEDVKRRLEEHLQIPEVSVRFKAGRQNKMKGAYFPVFNSIVIELGIGLFEKSGLRGINVSVVQTLLHEYRHAWQQHHWSQKQWDRDERRNYYDQECERDANQWADENTVKWLALVKVKPKRPVSKLARLSAAERRAA